MTQDLLKTVFKTQKETNNTIGEIIKVLENAGILKKDGIELNDDYVKKEDLETITRAIGKIAPGLLNDELELDEDYPSLDDKIENKYVTIEQFDELKEGYQVFKQEVSDKFNSLDGVLTNVSQEYNNLQGRVNELGNIDEKIAQQISSPEIANRLKNDLANALENNYLTKDKLNEKLEQYNVENIDEEDKARLTSILNLSKELNNKADSILASVKEYSTAVAKQYQSIGNVLSNIKVVKAPQQVPATA